ncbi:MAG: hypothetical protein ACI8W3_000985 [Myxococcota bacterium]
MRKYDGALALTETLEFSTTSKPKWLTALILAIFVALAVSSVATAQTNDESDGEWDTGSKRRAQRDYNRNDNRNDDRYEKVWSVRGGLGFTEDPDSFLLNAEIERFVRDEVTVGLGMQLGVGDDGVIVSPMLFTRFVFDLTSFENEFIKRLQPFGQAGAGITHINKDLPGKDRDGTDFLLSVGAGFEYKLNDPLSLGTRMLVNIIPGEVLSERIYFSWEVISLRYSW